MSISRTDSRPKIHWSGADGISGAAKRLWFNHARYDRVGHFAQGFVPAIIAREILIRKTPLRPGPWLNFLTITICQAISAWYEFVEWWTAVAGGAKSDAFLGTQGDLWDTQWDMLTCLIGASVALLTIRKLHDHQLRSIE